MTPKEYYDICSMIMMTCLVVTILTGAICAILVFIKATWKEIK